MTENPKGEESGVATGADVLSSVLSTIRLTGSLQFCFMPPGDWQTDEKGSILPLAGNRRFGLMPFHIVADGHAWVKMEGGQTELEAGDVLVFPHRTTHDLGGGNGGAKYDPGADLPPKPWRKIPTLQYSDTGSARILCGYVRCEALSFAPLRDALPKMVHVRTRGLNDNDWLGAAVRQLVAEVDRPLAGGQAMLERLTETMFVELLRQRILAADPGSVGWLAALADPVLVRAIALIHDDADKDWTVESLAAASGVSRTTLADRFQAVLGTSPIKYLREWRLYLASVMLAQRDATIAQAAHQAGYAAEAAFNRAFSRSFGMPPAAWRDHVRS